MLKWINKKLNNKKGFSLIELIVVVGILGILAAVAIPRVTTSLDDARDSANNANARIIRNAIEFALVEEDLVINTDDQDGLAVPATPNVDLDYAEIMNILVPKYIDSTPDKTTSGGTSDFTITVSDSQITVD